MSLTKQHIHQLVTHFYAEVAADTVLGPIFNDVAKVDWEHHIPLLCQFWNSIMLKSNEYHGGAYMKHVLLGQKVKLSAAHFSRWLEIFSEQAYMHLPEQAAGIITERASLIADSLMLGCL
jgi:hemoglobin